MATRRIGDTRIIEKPTALVRDIDRLGKLLRREHYVMGDVTMALHLANRRDRIQQHATYI